MNSQADTRGDRPFLARLFVSPDEARLRAGWRITVHAMLIMMVSSLPLLAFSIVFFLMQGAIDQQAISEFGLTASALIFGPSVVAATWIARRYLDKRSFSSLGFQFKSRALRDFLIGLGLPATIMGAIFMLEWSVGWLQIEGFIWDDSTFSEIAGPLLLIFFVFIAVGFYEEILFRGYYMQNLLESLGRPLALFLTSAVFGLVHLNNPNSNLISVLGITAAGYFLAFGWLRSQALWLPIGLHIGWNFFEGPIFGFPVSGIQFFSLIQVNVQGPQIVTGGAFGPEGGLILFPVLAVAAGVIWLYTRDRNEEVETS